MVDRQFHGNFRNTDRTHHATAGIQQTLVLRVRRTGACGTGVRTTLAVRFCGYGQPATVCADLTDVSDRSRADQYCNIAGNPPIQTAATINSAATARIASIVPRA